MLDNTNGATVAPDTWIAEVTQNICDVWAKQAFHRPKDRANGIATLLRRRSDFDARVAATAGLIEAVAPCLAQPGELTDAEYKTFLLQPLHTQLSFLEASVRAELARSLVALHAATTPSPASNDVDTAEAVA